MTTARPPARRPARISAPHRRLRLAGAVAAVGVRSALLGRRSASPRRGRASVYGAARILTAAGVRVRVVAPTSPWPRSGGHLVVSGSAGRIGELALLTAVPRTVGGWTELAERVLGGRRTSPLPSPEAGVLLPVAVRYRYEADEDWLADEEVPRDLAAAARRPGLVVEVRLLPALRPVDEVR